MYTDFMFVRAVQAEDFLEILEARVKMGWEMLGGPFHAEGLFTQMLGRRAA